MFNFHLLGFHKSELQDVANVHVYILQLNWTELYFEKSVLVPWIQKCCQNYVTVVTVFATPLNNCNLQFRQSGINAMCSNRIFLDFCNKSLQESDLWYDFRNQGLSSAQ